MTTAPAPVDAIAAVTQAGSGGSPTRCAIEAALAGLALDSAAQQAASPSVTANQSALRASQDGLHDASTSQAFSPAALAQRASPLPAGADVQATQALSVPAVEAAAQTHNAAAPQAMPLQGVLAVPVALSTLQTSSATSSARAQGAGQDERLARVQRHDGQRHGQETFDDGDANDDELASQDEPSPGEEPVADDRIARWLHVLTAAGQDEALRDLRLSRHVLLVLPQGGDSAVTVPARAVLLGSRGVALLDAQWWPGAAANDAPSWQRFRLFRDGDLLLRGGMRTRAGNRACRLLLGAGSAAAANAAGGWIDAQAARLLLSERARVAQALLAQWTLLMLIVPQGAAHA